MIIRPEKDLDIDAIFEVTREAFKDHPHSRQTEQFIVNALRAVGALAVSIVADIEGTVAGHIAFSPVIISDGSSNWYGMGPLSVLPGLQKRGIGKALVIEGLNLLKTRGAAGCALVGDPEYYTQFGLKNIADLIYESIPRQNFLVLPYGNNWAKGNVQFRTAFSATS